MCPFTSLPPGEGPNRFSPSSIQDWQPRRKSVSNACERCRRRKIKCDGDTPCATCSRFSLQCIRTQKPREVVASEHQAALESRIHQLEAQLAAHVNAPMHGMEGIDQNLMAASSSFGWQTPPPPLTVDTAFSTPYSAGSDIDLGAFSAGSVPSIAVTECEPVPQILSPESPVPSFWSGTTRASSPELPPTTSAPQFPQTYALPPTTNVISPPIAPHAAPSWEFMSPESSSQLKGKLPQSKELSRQHSMSSMSIDESEESPEDEGDVLPMAPVPRLPRQGIFSASTESPPPGRPRSGFSDRSRAINIIPFPSRFEAETLTSEFVQYLESMEDARPYSISPSVFGMFCDSVYPDPKSRSSSADTSVSVPMARFHVFLAMAIGMKVRIKDSAEKTNSLLDRCYELAMQQAYSSVFWQENGGIEAAQLLSIFASLRKDPTFEPRPLQPSFSW